MISKDKEVFLKQCPTGTLVGIDYSASRVGIAVTDAQRFISSPLTILNNEGHHKLCASLDQALQEYQPVGFVIGWPMHMDGNACEQCPAIERFAHILQEHVQLPILLFDERLTSKIADAFIAEGKKTQAGRKKIIDKVAASVMLEGVLAAP